MLASSWAQKSKVSYQSTKMGSFVTTLVFSEHRSTRTNFLVSSLPRNQAMGFVPDDCIWIYPEHRQGCWCKVVRNEIGACFGRSCDWYQPNRLNFVLGMGIWRRWGRCLRRGWWKCLQAVELYKCNHIISPKRHHFRIAHQTVWVLPSEFYLRWLQCQGSALYMMCR